MRKRLKAKVFFLSFFFLLWNVVWYGDKRRQILEDIGSDIKILTCTHLQNFYKTLPCE